MSRVPEGGMVSTVRYGVLPRDRKRELFGLECADALEWRSWTPGTEYSKNYVLKNVGTEALRLNYKQTASKSFSMDFPETIKLRPGMSHALKVMFRPLKLQQYSDHIEIFCNNSSFIVLVEAYPPATQVEIPSQLDFGFVPTKEMLRRSLVVRNTGATQVGLSWKLEAPFSISPAAVTFQPGQSATFEVSFQPLEACSYDVHALCQLDTGISTTVKISGIGKFPYLSVEQPSVDFGSVLVGKSVERSFRFGNHSVVDANFTIVHSEGSDDGVFSVTPTKGTLGPDEYTLMTVAYSPKHTGTFSSETFSITTAGGNKLALNLRGMAVGPKVSLSANSLNFGNVPAGQTPSRVVYLQNQSDVPVFYDFQLDPEDTFSISRPRGAIAAQSTGHVTVTFRASAPANYWKRVACLIKDADPLSIDLLATYYDDKSRPPPLTARHIASYMERVLSGGAPVEQDPAAFSQPPSPVPSNPASRPTSGVEAERLAASGAGSLLGASDAAAAQAPLAGPDSWQLFFNGQDPGSAVTVDASVLDFGTCSRLSASEYKMVTVTNNTAAKVTAFFCIPGWQDPAGGPPKPVFQVFPDVADIKPHQQVTFRVAFRPPRDAQHYCQTLHLRAFVKSMRNFRLVPDALVVPPWSVPVTASGNTFLHSNPEFAPKVELTHRAVAFPPCRPGEQVHQTVMIANYGDTPAAFAFHTAGLGPHFSIEPAQGLVPAKGSVLLGLRFAPGAEPSSKPISAQATCSFNGVAVTAVPLLLTGSAHVPRLTFDVPGGTTLFFRPTCLGAVSTRALRLHNPSRVPVAFAWALPSKLSGVVSVSPATGVLRGNEGATVTWTFAPNQMKVLEQRVPCLLSDPEGSPAGTTSRLPDGPLPEDGEDGPEQQSATARATNADRVFLTIVGEGTQGALAIEPPNLDLGVLPVGHAVRRTLSLLNQSDGVLRYRLECGPATSGAEADGPLEPGATPVEFPQQGLTAVEPRPGEEIWVDEPEGAIPARASKEVSVTFFPRFRKPYRLEVRCRTSTVAPLPTATVPLGATATAGGAAPGGRPNSGGSPARLLPPLSKARSSSGALALGTSTALSNAPQQAAAAAAAAAAAGGGVHDDVDKWPAPAVCPIAADTAFPGLVVTDVYLDGVPKQVVWDMLRINDLNAELQKQVTELELDLNRMEVKGTLTAELTQRALSPFLLDFGTHLVAGNTVKLGVEISNATDLPVHWELSTSDSSDLEMENWVEPGRPRNDQEKAIDFITENKIFEAHPRGGVLEARGASVTVTMIYRPSHAGTHDLPVFLRMKNGKRMQVLLHGETVCFPPPQRLLMSPAQRVLTFEPTPLGEEAPPLHLQLLRSGGPGELRYQLDLAALAHLAKESWGFEVIKLCSEASGSMPERGASALNWQFTPLEARHYSVDVPVLLADNTLEVITLQGRGCHPLAPDAVAPVPGEGSRVWNDWRGFGSTPTASPAGGRLAVLCHDVVSLGTTLPQGVTRRIVVLTNTSHYPITFDWDPCLFPAQPPHVSGSGSAIKAGLAISPRCGKLEPGEQVVVRFTLEAGVSPQLFEAEVRVAVRVDEEAMFERAQEVLREAEAAGPQALDYTDTGSVIEEVIEESRDRRERHHAMKKVKHGQRPRLPLHLCMTTAIRLRINNLDDQYSRTLERLTQRHLAATQTPDVPEPQTIAVMLSGRILTDAHVKVGRYIPNHELEASRLLLEGASWPRPPVEAPTLPEPSATGGEEDEEAAPEAAMAGDEAAEEGVEGVVEEVAGAVREGGAEDVAVGARDQDEAASGEGAVPGAKAAAAAPPEGHGSEAAMAAEHKGEAQSVPAPAKEEQQEKEEEFKDVWRPLPAPAAVPPPPAPARTREQQAAAAALAVLQGMLATALDPAKFDVLGDAWRCLAAERVPTFAELREQLPDGFPEAGGDGDEDDGVAAAGEGEEEEAQQAGVDAVLHDKEFQAFAEYVLESAVLGLVSESAAGEWEA